MLKKELMNKIEMILHDVKTAVLATVDDKGKPRMRWMSPVLLDGETRMIYAVTSPHFSKAQHLEKHPDAEWLFQSRDLREVIRVKGKINILENPSLKARVMEEVAGRLHIFWSLSKKSSDYNVLETVIEEAEYFLPMKPSKVKVTFTGKN